MSAQPKVYITVEDYLTRERGSDTKHEYHAGQIYALAGGSESHNLIAGNVLASLHAQLRRRPCTVYPSDMRIKIPRTTLYTYADVTVVCGQPQFEDDQRDILLNPTVVVEVLSPSTESYDRGKKFQNYRTLPSVREYLLIAQDSYYVEHYVRQPDNQWLMSEFDAVEATMTLPSIESALALADVYEKVTFEETP